MIRSIQSVQGSGIAGGSRPRSKSRVAALAGALLLFGGGLLAQPAFACGPGAEAIDDNGETSFSGSSNSTGMWPTEGGPGMASGTLKTDCPIGTGMLTLNGTQGDGTNFSFTSSSCSFLSNDSFSCGGSGNQDSIGMFGGTFTGNLLVQNSTATITGSLTSGSFPMGTAIDVNITGSLGANGAAEDPKQEADVLADSLEKTTVLAVRRGSRTTGANARAGARGSRAVFTGESNGLAPLAGGVRYQGTSAGDGFAYPYGLWAAYDYVDFDDDTGGAGMDGDTNTFLAGADLSPWDGTAFGVAFGYESSDMDTLFNGGDLEVDGYSVIPYAAFYLSDYVGTSLDLSADFSVGFSFVDIDRSRLVGGAPVRGSTESDRIFFSGNLTAGKSFGALYLSGITGVLMAREDIDGFRDSNGTVIPDTRNEFGQFQLGGEAAYGWGGFEPYVGATWLHAYDREESAVLNDEANSFQLGGGLRYYGSSFSGSLGYTTLLGRDDVDEHAFSVQIRADF